MEEKQFTEHSLDQMKRQEKEWVCEVGKAIQSEPPRLPEFATVSDIEVKPVYSCLDVQKMDYEREIGFPGFFPSRHEKEKTTLVI